MIRLACHTRPQQMHGAHKHTHMVKCRAINYESSMKCACVHTEYCTEYR